MGVSLHAKIGYGIGVDSDRITEGTGYERGSHISHIVDTDLETLDLMTFGCEMDCKYTHVLVPKSGERSGWQYGATADELPPEPTDEQVADMSRVLSTWYGEPVTLSKEDVKLHIGVLRS